MESNRELDAEASHYGRRPRRRWLRWLFGGFFGLLAILVTGFAAIYLSHLPIPELGDSAPVHRGVSVAEFAPKLTEASESLLEARTELAAPSLSVAVAQGGKIVWSEAVGYASIEDLSPATVDTIYPIGSVSKPVTAALTMLLAEDGTVDLDADIRTYLPSFPEKREPITLRQLLSHQAGIRHYGFDFVLPTFSEAALDEEFADTKQALELFEDDPLLFDPDTDFAYSTFGYTLISAVLEEATNEDFLSLMDRRIFSPLEMANSGPERPLVLGDRLADGYVGLLSRQLAMPAPSTNHSYKWAGGGLASTPSDLARFASSLLSDGLLKHETRDEMFTIGQTEDGELNEQHYALGWRIGGYQRGEDLVTLINHGGSTAGGTAILLIFPEHDLVIAMCANTVRAGGSGVILNKAASIASIFLPQEKPS